MKKWLKRIRGAVGMGLTWAAGWFGVGVIIGLVMVVIGGGPVGLVTNSVGLAFAGFGGGAAFSVVLGIAEGRRRFDEMSLPRFAGWGALGGLLLFTLLGGTGGVSALGSVVAASVLTLLGASSAAGSLALARRAEDRELLKAGEEALGLTEGG